LACSQGSDFGTGRSFGRGSGGRMGGGRGFGDSLCLFYIHILPSYLLLMIQNLICWSTNAHLIAEVWQGWSGKHLHKAMCVTDARCLVCWCFWTF